VEVGGRRQSQLGGGGGAAGGQVRIGSAARRYRRQVEPAFRQEPSERCAIDL